MITKCYKISGCRACPNYDHSGGFTPGGAIPLCTVVKDKKSKYGVKSLPFDFSPETGLRRFGGEIPDWCPLPDFKGETK